MGNRRYFVEFRDYTGDVGDKLAEVTGDEYDRLHPHELDLENGTYPAAVEGLVLEVQRRARRTLECAKLPRGATLIEIAVC